jgi:hypothetical protein
MATGQRGWDLLEHGCGDVGQVCGEGICAAGTAARPSRRGVEGQAAALSNLTSNAHPDQRNRTRSREPRRIRARPDLPPLPGVVPGRPSRQRPNPTHTRVQQPVRQHSHPGSGSTTTRGSDRSTGTTSSRGLRNQGRRQERLRVRSTRRRRTNGQRNRNLSSATQ